MILYFSGTGNSRYAAQYIGNIIRDEIVSINDKIKKLKDETLHSEKPLVFVCPTYAWRIPKVVETFIKKSEFSGNKNVYFILTCGADIGNATFYIKKLCLEKELNLQGVAGIVMPDNYIVMYDVVDNHKVKQLLRDADKSLHRVAKTIKSGAELPTGKENILDTIKSSVVNPMFYQFFVSAKGFYSTESCIHCGKCQDLCPLNNIMIVNGRPKWGDNCTHCMACISRCPKSAIEYKNKTKDRHRYYNAGYQKKK